ncbi:D-alanyl-D-alanine carboxypeptidase/D-alanyl-D-alanine endopeptidase [Sediminibacterium ginsengisoli]|uniref:D-alanyl-D-alanine carboxypeptidase / D-alanyl-D-alanine-endopeptidase (Penicillin-binding protein 4) n=1 Tax=Sediminibacterium ginsengisoli TaxID=413434 RepID=A0A1T4PMB1_9BACT|nr:D-alanyl-D-alanine carboxypeptidase/D-alanyl-D-alanine-endopeptidase [Sediminibacterium ginsengisoli]SJZ92357.1 D-alanyl-D-alanine carboxypeptidase / D-alanyl-D-alanine-endopeptidase (penicillin-binding protein 4) [Sediminibacterium ginsengisoli]
MKKYWFSLLLLSFSGINAQSLTQRLESAAAKLVADAQMRTAIAGVYVVKSATGEPVFSLNAQTGLAPASCQKTITSAAAMELLGAGYRFRTEIAYSGAIKAGVLEGDLHITGFGDPTLGSWRYDSTKDEKLFGRWIAMLKAKGITRINGSLVAHTANWEKETLPGGWIWDDIGNYYGAGSAGLNWRENQYDLILSSGEQGEKASIVKTEPVLYDAVLQSELRAGAKGSGDNAYIYLPPFSQRGFVRGTISPNEKAFTISGSFPDPASQFIHTVADRLNAAGISTTSFGVDDSTANTSGYTLLHTENSPALDSVNYWFMKKSINLYGESLLKAIAFQQGGFGSTDKGVQAVKNFWKQQGIDPAALRMIDGSGLSPQNRVTAESLVKVLQFARSRPWFNYYYDALPLYNQMKLKSGTIGGAKSFAGYHTAKDGTTYTVAIIINNFDGSANEIVKKMFLLLDELK